MTDTQKDTLPDEIRVIDPVREDMWPTDSYILREISKEVYVYWDVEMEGVAAVFRVLNNHGYVIAKTPTIPLSALEAYVERAENKDVDPLDAGDRMANFYLGYNKALIDVLNHLKEQARKG